MGLIIRMSLINDGLKSKCALTVDIHTGTGRTYSASFLFWGLCCQRETLAFLPSNSNYFLLKYDKVQRVSDI